MTTQLFVSARACALVALLVMVGGCSEYAVPGAAAKLAMSPTALALQTDPSVNRTLERKPTVTFPARVAFVRVQAGDYRPLYGDVIGGHDLSVLLTQDPDAEKQLQKLQKLAKVSGLVPLNRLELPSSVDNEEQLRDAAASLHADMLLIYTFDDNLERHDVASAMTLLTLGISPNIVFNLSTTASAVLVDTRNGYIYGSAMAADKRSGLANAWGEIETGENLRKGAEDAAFERLVDSLTKTWDAVLKEYDKPAAAMGDAGVGGVAER